MSLTNSPFWFSSGATSAGGGGFYTYEIDQSIRCNRPDAAYVYRSPGSNGNRQTFTLSAWVKRANISSGAFIFGAGTSGSQYMFLGFNNNGQLTTEEVTGSQVWLKQSTAVYRDVSAWYHVVLAVDTTDGTASNRVKLWVNNERITSFASNTDPSQNAGTYWNGTTRHDVGGASAGNSSLRFDGFIAEVHSIDGTALDPTSFGESKNGVWVPKKYNTADGAYGTNGFYLKFADNSTASALGTDSSGQGNTFSVTNFSTTDQVLDSPTNNFATWNVLQPTGAAQGTMTLTEGNLKATGGSSIYRQVMGNISVLSGKWYTELYITDAGYPSWQFGWTKATRYEAFTGASNQSTDLANFGYFTGPSVYISTFGQAATGTTYAYSSLWSGARAPTTGDVIGCAADFDNGKFWWSINGEWINIGAGAGDPANGTNPSATYTASTYADDFKTPHYLNYNGSAVLNTGQDSTFVGNTTAGGNADANGIGDFKYAVPSGFLALNSANLPEVTIGPNSDTMGDEHFNTAIWSGNSTSGRDIVTGHATDFVWIKSRSNATNHYLFDSIRGVNNQLLSNADSAEAVVSSNRMTAFNADGFEVGNFAETNGTGYTFVGWSWKAGGTAVSNTNGSIASSVSANQDAGFSMVSWTAQAGTYTVGHGLSQKPELIITKNRNTTGGPWYTFTTAIDGTLDYLALNTTAAALNDPFGTALPTASVFSGTNNYFYSSGGMIAYCFHSVDGFSKVGSFIGAGSPTFVYTGFRPAWIMVKNYNTSTHHWVIYDNKRNTYNVIGNYLYANLPSAEQNATRVDFVSNGFVGRANNYDIAQSGVGFIYLAFAEQPFKYANAR